MTPKSEPTGAESAILNSLVKARTNVVAETLPLWNARELDKSTASSFARDLKAYNCSNCTNGSCTACMLRKRIDMESLSLSLADEQKGGEGSGFTHEAGHVGIPGEQGGSRDSTPNGGSPNPNLGSIAKGRVQFHKNRLAREIVAHSARIKQIDEKPFRGIKDRLEARAHLKALKKKAKELNIPEDQVWQVIDTFPPREQAFLAETAKLDKNNSTSMKIAKGVGGFILRQGIQMWGAKYAPSPLIEEGEVKKMTIGETAAYLAAYATDPAQAVHFLDALKNGQIQKAHAIQLKGFQDARSNTQNHLRDKSWLEAAGAIRQVLERQQKLNPHARPVTQREFEKIVNDVQANRSREILRQHRTTSNDPTRTIRMLGFGGKA